MADEIERDGQGRFAPGNAGGPGRPRRAVEIDYQLAISEAITLADWRAIVDKARQLALAGDSKAREWLSRFLIGDSPINLLDFAAREALGITADRLIAARADELANPPSAFSFGDPPTLDDRALEAIKAEHAELERDAIKAERERRKAAKAAAAI